MAIFNLGNVNVSAIVSRATALLTAHRDTLADIQLLYGYLITLSAADWTALGFDTTTGGNRDQLMSALADANAEGQIHNTGQAPSTYPQVAAPYVYKSSQTIVIGPQ